ncbi:hypothetical protein UFOVP328_259 [uncultured Caudovirales phage]|uniref:Uncharacterized protein n=1 Tax=uncultured Caudovirales phage TaxID=2100421 RepID=A0A6J5LYS8_9CAUD|nr:hypothetical protein UFOVP328_259 [uncultured Caudovirales phage]
MAISRVAGQMLQTVLERDGVNISFANANVGINTNTPGSALEVAGNLTVGNVVISNVGNINAGNVNINQLAEPQANADAATKFYVDSKTGNISGIGNLTVSNTTISTSTADANILIDPNGTGTFVIVGTNGFVIPTGTTAQRPATGNVAGTVRFNTDTDEIEVYDGSEWDSIVSDVTNQVIVPDGVSTVYTLDKTSTASGILVMINGLVQIPGIAYSYTVTGNQITFSDVPLVSDIVDIRFL